MRLERLFHDHGSYIIKFRLYSIENEQKSANFPAGGDTITSR